MNKVKETRTQLVTNLNVEALATQISSREFLSFRSSFSAKQFEKKDREPGPQPSARPAGRRDSGEAGSRQRSSVLSSLCRYVSISLYHHSSHL